MIMRLAADSEEARLMLLERDLKLVKLYLQTRLVGRIGSSGFAATLPFINGSRTKKSPRMVQKMAIDMKLVFELTELKSVEFPLDFFRN